MLNHDANIIGETSKNILILRPHIFMRDEDLEKVKQDVRKQILDGIAVVSVPSFIEIIMIPKGTIVEVQNVCNPL